MLYKEAKTFKQKVMCLFAKMTHGHVVTPLGRVILLHSDYKEAERIYKLNELYPHLNDLTAQQMHI